VGGVAVLTLNRPEYYNALSSALLARLHAELDAIAGDRAVRVVVIAGQGRAFCSGHDLRELGRAAGPDKVVRLFRTCSDFMLKLVRLPQPAFTGEFRDPRRRRPDGRAREAPASVEHQRSEGIPRNSRHSPRAG
jgi:hypothetical protein